MPSHIVHDHNRDGVDRRGFLECMAWSGTGLIWTLSGGVLSSRAFGGTPHPETPSELSFVQISDSHIGFKKPVNSDVTATLQIAVDKVSALPRRPDFVLHTGDLTHSSRAAEFDTLEQVLKGMKVPAIFYVPGEHDTLLMTASSTWRATEKARMDAAGTASTTKARTLSDW